MLNNIRLVCGAAALLALSGCARDVVIKPAVIAFNADAHASIDAARLQYDSTIARLNRQTADFIARNPDCGLASKIVPRRRNPAAPQTGGYCLSEAEMAALPDTARLVTETLPIATRDTFAVQFRAIDLLLDYVTVLASRADDPKLTVRADILSAAGAIKGLGQGVSDLKVALHGSPLKEFADGGPVEKFAGAIGDLANQIELIADQASDVAALEAAIKAGQQPVNTAIDQLAASADAWNCAALERRQIDANAYAGAWNPKLATLDIDARREIAANWLGQVQIVLPAWCPGAGTTAQPAIRSQVANMLVALRAANDELIDIANHNYTPAQRKAIAEATLSRLGTLLSRLAAVIPLLP